MTSFQSRLKRLTPAVAGLALLAACSTMETVPAADWQQGARRAWVMSDYAPDAVTTALPPCLASLPAADYANRHFVRVLYRHAKIMHEEVAELPPGLQAKSGDRVELWPADCQAGQLSRIAKVF